MKQTLRNLLIMCLTAVPLWGHAQVGEDVTSLLVDPDMDAMNSWTNNGFKSSAKGNNYAPMFGGNFIEQWTSSTAESVNMLADLSIEQSLTDLPNGAYLFSAACIACQQGDESIALDGVYLYANDANTAVATGNGVPERFYVMAVVSDGNLNVGFKTVSTTANWIAWDKAKLFYYSDVNVNEQLAVSILALQESVAASEAYADSIKMQISVYTALVDAVTKAKGLISNGASNVDEVVAAKSELDAAMEAADASIEAYKNLIAETEVAQGVFEAYSEESDVIDALEVLYTAVEKANAMYAAATSDTAEISQQILALENAAADVKVGVEIYICLDSLGNILNTCEVGTSYGCFSQAWMDAVEALTNEMNAYFEMYQNGDIAALELLPIIEAAYQTLTSFWASMITIDFSLPLNSSLFPYSADIAVESAEHDRLFMGDEGPWSFGEINSDNTINIWTYDNAGCDNGYSEDGKGTANDILTWHDLVPTSWQYVRTDGIVHSLQNKPMAAVFTAPEDAVYMICSAVSSQDANRVSKGRGDMRSYAYFIQEGSVTLSQITDPVSYNYDTDPAQYRFFANLKAGDKIAITAADCRHSSNGNQLSKIDTLYVLGNKDEENGYTRADAEESGLIFFNPYTPAEDWSELPEAIAKGKEALADTKDRVGEGYSLIDSVAYAALESLIKDAENMLAVQLASQPDVNQMILDLDNCIKALYASAGYAICLASDVLPVDTLVDFTDWQMLPDGLYYIQDATTGNYATAPNSDADKQNTYLSALIDETMSLQNAQVWHLAYADTCGAYAIGSFKNNGETWTIEQETEAGTSTSKGFYHIAENMQSRTGSVHFVLDPASVLWRSFRIYYNGTNYCLVGGTGDFASGWKNVMLPGGSTLGRGYGADFNFGWNLIPFTPNEEGQGIANVDSQTPVAVSYFNLMGIQLDKAEAGVVIKRMVYADGTVKAIKVLVK